MVACHSDPCSRRSLSTEGTGVSRTAAIKRSLILKAAKPLVYSRHSLQL
jgi:hypothetical protein